ncbi:MAG TPA: hypothetical protein VKE69_02905, partial [Planctomycetota bacterium]|nr:hypothetical protein [Planctomycetota bacterium]
DLLILTEADGSFRAKDVPKLLAYVESSAVVLGTRTTRQMVEQGANMGFAVRWANVAMAKILEGLWFWPHEPRLTDVGCTYRAMSRSAWLRVRGGCREAGPSFSPEMICETYRHGLRVVEIPVHYFRRLGGHSKHAESFGKLAKMAAHMLRTILRKRLEASPRVEPSLEPAAQPSEPRN